MRYSVLLDPRNGLCCSSDCFLVLVQDTVEVDQQGLLRCGGWIAHEVCP